MVKVSGTLLAKAIIEEPADIHIKAVVFSAKNLR